MPTYQYSDELMHYGIKGMKWGVRRAARIEKSDARYREKQLAKTAKYYDKTQRSGFYGSKKTEGIKSLQKKLDSNSNKYDKAVVKGQLEARKALRDAELTKVKNLTHDQIQKERVAVGKSIAKDVITSVGVSAVLLPTTGFFYTQASSTQEARHRVRNEY